MILMKIDFLKFSPIFFFFFFFDLNLKGLAMIFPGQENPFIIFRNNEIYMYSKTNNKIPINLLK